MYLTNRISVKIIVCRTYCSLKNRKQNRFMLELLHDRYRNWDSFISRFGYLQGVVFNELVGTGYDVANLLNRNIRENSCVLTLQLKGSSETHERFVEALHFLRFLTGKVPCVINFNSVKANKDSGILVTFRVTLRVYYEFIEYLYICLISFSKKQVSLVASPLRVYMWDLNAFDFFINDYSFFINKPESIYKYSEEIKLSFAAQGFNFINFYQFLPFVEKNFFLGKFQEDLNNFSKKIK